MEGVARAVDGPVLSFDVSCLIQSLILLQVFLSTLCNLSPLPFRAPGFRTFRYVGRLISRMSFSLVFSSASLILHHASFFSPQSQELVGMICTLPQPYSLPLYHQSPAKVGLIQYRPGQGQAMIALVLVPILWLGETGQAR